MQQQMKSKEHINSWLYSGTQIRTSIMPKKPTLFSEKSQRLTKYYQMKIADGSTICAETS
nr:unnamed protein product [Callosobruchus chinensis]